MNTDSGWVGYNDFEFGLASSECAADECAVIRHAQNSYSAMYRSTYFSSAFSSLQLQAQLNGVGLETGSGDACQVYYCYENGGSVDTCEWYQVGDDYGNGQQSISIDLPATVAGDPLWVSFDLAGSGNPAEDACYIDNVVMRGMRETTTTSEPTATAPTPNPVQTPGLFTANANRLVFASL